MVAGHMTKKNGYWYLILMVRDETGRLKQKWISTHLRVEGNKKKAEAMLLAARREYTDFAEMPSKLNQLNKCCEPVPNPVRVLFCSAAASWLPFLHSINTGGVS